MRHLRQPPGSSLCGHAVAAMLADCSLLAAVLACDQRPSEGLTLEELRHGLRILGIRLGSHLWGPNGSGNYVLDLTPVGLGNGHWCAAHVDIRDVTWVHDPAMRSRVRFEHFITRYMRGWKIDGWYKCQTLKKRR